MMFRRSTLEAVVLEGCIYALGGRDKSYTSSVEKLDITSKKWEMVPAMNYKRISFGAVAVHGYIFVVGRATVKVSCFFLILNAPFDDKLNDSFKISTA